VRHPWCFMMLRIRPSVVGFPTTTRAKGASSLDIFGRTYAPRFKNDAVACSAITQEWS
jgi:hypothetical protein